MLNSVTRGLSQFGLLVALLGAGTTGLAAEHPGPTQVVDRLHASLIKAMQAEDLDFQGRFQFLGPVIDESFDFETIARVVTGRYWNDLSDEERAKFLKLFSEVSTATYADRFDSFSGESFRTLAEEAQNNGYRLVKTELVKSDGEAVELTYMLHDNGEAWRIVNVIADGVSDLGLKRADYTAVIKTGGFESLLAKLNDQLLKYRDDANE